MERETYLLERAEAREDAAAGPRGVYALRWCKNLDPHVLHRQSLHLVEQSVTEALCQCGTAREHNVAVESFPQVHVRSVYCFDDDLVHTRVLEADDLGVEEDLGRSKPFSADLGVSAPSQKK
jgi:hypothetical protein